MKRFLLLALTADTREEELNKAIKDNGYDPIPAYLDMYQWRVLDLPDK